MSADKSFTSPIPFDLANDLTCPPPPRAHKSSITFAYADTFITISTDTDDDDNNSVDHTHTNDTKDDTPFFFPKSSSIPSVLGANVSSTEMKYTHAHAHTMMRNRPEVSFTLKKRKRVSPEIRLPIVQFPVLPLYPTNQESASSTVEQIPRCKSEPFKTEVRTSLPPNIKQRRRTSIARCA